MAFTEKKIDLIFSLGKDSSGAQQTFSGQNGADQVTVSGLRVSCKIVKNGGAQMNMAEIRVFGLTPTVYNALTSIYQVTQAQLQNTVTVMAGDDSGMAQVFIGQITLAQIDLNHQPDCVMNIIAQTALLQAISTDSSTTFAAGTDFTTAVGVLVKKMGLKNFEPNGVQQILSSSMTLNGPARQQAITLIEAAIPPISYSFDDDALVLIPKNGFRQNQASVIISPETGMIGYPTYSNIGIGLKTLYNPAIKWGQRVQVKSSLDVAKLNGMWTVFNIVHTLESQVFGGRWDTEMQAMAESIS